MCALNLMKYRDTADYADGRETELSGLEADEAYMPHEHLAAVGSRIILVAPVVHRLVGDEWTWDRIAIAQYRDRMAMIEMNASREFQKAEEHKDAGMEFTIVLATFPADEGSPTPRQSAADDDRLLLLQVVADTATADLAADIESTRVGRFAVEDRILGDERTFAEARFDLITPDVAAELAAAGQREDPADYVVIADPVIDEVARSLSDPTRVLF